MTTSDKKSVSSSLYIPVYSIPKENSDGIKTDFLSVGKNEDSYSEQYDLVYLTIEAPLVKDGIYLKMMENKKMDGNFSEIVEMFSLVPLARHYPCIPQGVTFMGYILDNGSFVSADCFEGPNQTKDVHHFPCRTPVSGKKTISYTNDKDGSIQKNFDPYVHGLKLKTKV